MLELCPILEAIIQHSSCACILLPFIAHTCDDLCQNWRLFSIIFIKGVE